MTTATFTHSVALVDGDPEAQAPRCLEAQRRRDNAPWQPLSFTGVRTRGPKDPAWSQVSCPDCHQERYR